MRTLVLAVLAATLSLGTSFAVAQDRERIRLREAPRPIQQYVMNILRERGMQPSNDMVLAITTSDCPDNCNDKVAGGMCLCTPDSSGNCPSGTEKVPNEESCRVRPSAGNISGGGLTQPLQIQMP